MRPLTKRELELTIMVLSNQIIEMEDTQCEKFRKLIVQRQRFQEIYRVRYGEDTDEKEKGVLPKPPNG